MVAELQHTTDALTRKDIQEWRNAWQLAINVDSPNRKPLYDIYRDVDADLHLSGCIGQRKGFVMSRSFKIVGADGKEVEEAAHYFNQGMRWRSGIPSRRFSACASPRPPRATRRSWPRWNA